MSPVNYTSIRSILCWHWIEYLPDRTLINAMCINLHWTIIDNVSGTALYSYQTYNIVHATHHLIELSPTIVCEVGLLKGLATYVLPCRTHYHANWLFGSVWCPIV